MGLGEVVESLYGLSFEFLGVTFDTGDIYSSIVDMLNFEWIFTGSDTDRYVSGSYKFFTNSTINGSTLNSYVYGFKLAKYTLNVYNTAVSLALSLLVIFFMVSLIKMITHEGLERVSWERLAVKGAGFFLLYALIINGLDLFMYIAKAMDNISDKFMNTLGISGLNELYLDEDGTYQISDIGTMMVDAADSAGSLEKYVFYLVFILMAIPYVSTMIMIFSQVLTRVIRICLYVMFAPIPIAMAAEEETFRGKAISYFVGFASLGFEGIVIYIGLWVYCAGLSTLPDAIGTGGLGTSDGQGLVPAVILIMLMNGLFSSIIGMGKEIAQSIFSRG